MQHPVILLDSEALSVVPSLSEEHVLGFALIPTAPNPSALEVNPIPAEGPCILKSKTITPTHARVAACWRDVSWFGISGIALELPDRLFSKYLGCVIIQNGHVIGIVQATHSDAWGYPVDLLLARREPKMFCAKPLRLVPGYDEHVHGRPSRDEWVSSAYLFANPLG